MFFLLSSSLNKEIRLDRDNWRVIGAHPTVAKIMILERIKEHLQRRIKISALDLTIWTPFILSIIVEGVKVMTPDLDSVNIKCIWNTYAGGTFQ